MFIVTNRKWNGTTFTGKEAADHKLSHVIWNGEGNFERVAPVPFRRQLLDHLKDLAERHPRPLVVMPIHGYNNGWGEALSFFKEIDVAITQQIPGGVTVGFTWPSGGNVTKYVGDRIRARSTAVAFTSALTKALRLLQDQRCPAEIVPVAHSMGNYMLAKAVDYASEVAGHPSLHAFSDTLMIAPDVDGNGFEPGGVAHQLCSFSRRVTVYRSVHDGAILASRAKRANTTGPRLGRQGPNSMDLLPKNVVIVDASDHTEGVGPIAAHSHHFRSPIVLADMLAVAQGVDRTAIPNRERRANGEFFITGSEE